MQQNVIAHQDGADRFKVDMLSSASELEDFVYLISHDVRNSVRALIELPQWIEEDLLDAGVRVDGSVSQSIDLMNRHTGRLDRMLVDLLTFSRIGRMQEMRNIDVDVALSDMLEAMRIPSGFVVRAELETNRLVLGERDALTLFTQLVSNAVKHHDMSKGEVIVSLREENGRAVLRVSDDGPGIEAKYREQVFAAMTTLRPRDEVEGSGMGLAIVRKIAQTYGGEISLGAGLARRGTTVELKFPIRPTGPSDAPCLM